MGHNRLAFVYVFLLLTGSVNVSAQTVAVTVTSGDHFGAGVCLDTPCRRVLTAFHVLESLRANLAVEGVPVEDIQLWPEDPGNVRRISTGDNRVLRFDPARDYAILTLAQPLNDSFHGVALANGPILPDSPIFVVNRRGRQSGRILATGVDLATLDGPARVQGFTIDVPSRPGDSGSPVLDGVGRLIGIAIVSATGGRETLAIAAPVIPDRSPEPVSSDQRYSPVRERVLETLSAMRNLIATERIELPDGRVQNYELSVIDRKLIYGPVGEADGQVGLLSSVRPRRGAVSLTTWYDVMSSLAGLPFQYAGETLKDGRTLRMFQCSSSFEYTEGSNAPERVPATLWLFADSRNEPVLFTSHLDTRSTRHARSVRMDVEFVDVLMPVESRRQVRLPVSIATTYVSRHGEVSQSKVTLTGYQLLQSSSRMVEAEDGVRRP